MGVHSRLQKSSCPIPFMNWEKRGRIQSPKRKFQNPIFESLDELGKVMS